MTPTKVKMKSDSDNDSLNSFKSNRSSHSDRIIQLEEEFKSMKTEFKSVKAEFKAMEIGFNEKFDRILNYLDALNLSKKDDTVIIDESKSSVSTRADDPNQIIRNTNTSSHGALTQINDEKASLKGIKNDTMNQDVKDNTDEGIVKAVSSINTNDKLELMKDLRKQDEGMYGLNIEDPNDKEILSILMNKPIDKLSYNQIKDSLSDLNKQFKIEKFIEELKIRQNNNVLRDYKNSADGYSIDQLKNTNNPLNLKVFDGPLRFNFNKLEDVVPKWNKQNRFKTVQWILMSSRKLKAGGMNAILYEAKEDQFISYFNNERWLINFNQIWEDMKTQVWSDDIKSFKELFDYIIEQNEINDINIYEAKDILSNNRISIGLSESELSERCQNIQEVLRLMGNKNCEKNIFKMSDYFVDESLQSIFSNVMSMSQNQRKTFNLDFIFINFMKKVETMNKFSTINHYKSYSNNYEKYKKDNNKEYNKDDILQKLVEMLNSYLSENRNDLINTSHYDVTKKTRNRLRNSLDYKNLNRKDKNEIKDTITSNIKKKSGVYHIEIQQEIDFSESASETETDNSDDEENLASNR